MNRFLNELSYLCRDFIVRALSAAIALGFIFAVAYLGDYYFK